MWVAGIMQGLMWRAVNDGRRRSPTASSNRCRPCTRSISLRFLGGVLFLAGIAVMAYNLWRTVAGAEPAEAADPGTGRARTEAGAMAEPHERIEKNLGLHDRAR